MLLVLLLLFWFFCFFKKKNQRNVALFQNTWLLPDSNRKVFFFSLWRSEYHNQATWESGVASMMQNSKLMLLFIFVKSIFALLPFWWQQQVLNVASTEAAPTDIMRSVLKADLKGKDLHDFEEEEGEILSN